MKHCIFLVSHHFQGNVHGHSHFLQKIIIGHIRLFIQQVWVKGGVCVCVRALRPVPLFATPSRLGSSVHGIFQARILEWVTISYSRGLPDPGIESWVSCTGSRIFLPLCHQRSPKGYVDIFKPQHLNHL